MKTKNVKIAIEGFGELLCREKGKLVVKNRKGEGKRYSLMENSISEIQIRTGNLVSVSALTSIAFWNIPFIVLTRYGNPIAVLKNLQDDDHVKTRIAQYQALENGKGLEIAKAIVLAKIRGQNELLKFYGLRQLDYPAYAQAIKEITDTDMSKVRARLMSKEGHASEHYFANLVFLFDQAYRPEKLRMSTYLAYDGLDNIFNLSYRVLNWKVHIAILKAKLEPYLGYLHSIQFGLASLVFDLSDLYRYLVDNFLIGFCQLVKKSDFELRKEKYEGKKVGWREYLKEDKNRELVETLDEYFESTVMIPRIRIGQKQKLDTLIREEALLLAQFLRGERKEWIPRVVKL